MYTALRTIVAHNIVHKTDLIIFPLTLQTITIAVMMSIGGRRDERKKLQHLGPRYV